jgi:hypothetical protein
MIIVPVAEVAGIVIVIEYLLVYIHTVLAVAVQLLAAVLEKLLL